MVKKGYFIAPGRKRINPVLLAAIALAMAGCSYSSESRFSLAPQPPVFDPAAVHAVSPEPPRLMAFTGQAIPFPSHIKLSDAGMPMQDPVPVREGRALATSPNEKKCSIKDRFDRSALIAYQWDQNRVGLRVKGINMEDRGISEIKLEYKLKLQPEKTRKEKCRYEASWQGVVGSSYNEMFLRKENTVWGQIDDIGDDVEDALSKLF